MRFVVRPFAIGITAASVLLVAVGFLPLFAGPSYEYCLAAGLSVPLIAAWVEVALATAVRSGEILRANAAINAVPDAELQRETSAHAGSVLLRATGFALLIAGVALLHGLRAGFCDVWAGLQYLALGPGAGVFVGAAYGHWLGAACARAGVRRAWQRGVLCLLGPLSLIAFSFGRYYTSPIIFAFDQFVGFFAGTLYDTEIDGAARLLTYRVGSVGWVLVALGSAPLLRSVGRAGTLPVTTWRSCVAISLLGFALALPITWQGAALGHYQTSRSVREALGHSVRARRCEVVFPTSVLTRDAELTATECDAHLAQLERFFDVEFRQTVTVFVFASAEQKAALMGARNVYIAKPWRREVYLQAAGYPHPVLGHELAHVLAGALGVGPFQVAGPLGGWIPDPGRIEGFAVAAAPSEDDDLSVTEWAAAMQRLELLPPIASLFRLGFLGENSSKAYTAAGAFVTFLHERFGSGALHAWYAGASLEAATGRGVRELEADYQKALAEVPLSAAALAIAKARFERPAIFARRCPHEVDELLGEAQNALGQLDIPVAQQAYERVLRLDKQDYTAQLGLAQCALRSGNAESAQRSFQQLGLESPTQLQRAVALERAGDAALLAGQSASASALYRQASELLVDEDEQRTLELKQFAAADGVGPARHGLVTLLLGEAQLGTNWLESGASLGAWATVAPNQGVADYLLGRNLFGQGRWQSARLALERAVSREISLPFTRREAWRMRLVVACAERDLASASRAYDGYTRELHASANRRDGVRRFAARCGVPSAAIAP